MSKYNLGDVYFDTIDSTQNLCSGHGDLTTFINYVDEKHDNPTMFKLTCTWILNSREPELSPIMKDEY